jgi:hypothetical protein
MAAENISYQWYALRVRSRYENAVATHLQGKGYESLLPLYKSQRRWSELAEPLLLLTKPKLPPSKPPLNPDYPASPGRSCRSDIG